MTATPCIEMRELMTDLSRGVLDPADRARLETHARSCADCATALERERLTEEALSRLPRRAASEDFKARLRARLEQAPRAAAIPPPKIRPALVLGLAAAILVALGAFVAVLRLGPSAPEPMIAEAVNDHLRVLYAQNPLEIAASDQHQVKPWFSGRVDFAPALRFGGDDRFPLVGGAVAVFVDRKAALFVFKRRLHEITLLNFRSTGLRWPRSWNARIGGHPGLVTTRDGFHVILWQADELGYALTSDLSEPELRELAELLAGRAGTPLR